MNIKLAEKVNEDVVTVFFPSLSEFEVNESDDEDEVCCKCSTWETKRIDEFVNIMTLDLKNRSAGFNGWNRINLQTSNYKVIKTANRAFGYNGWKSEIKCIEILREQTSSDLGIFIVKYRAVSRVTLKDGVFCEGEGIGEAKEFGKKSLCYFKAKRLAILRSLNSSLLGLCELR